MRAKALAMRKKIRSTRPTCTTSPGATASNHIMYEVMPPELTGVDAPIVVLYGRDFPTGIAQSGRGVLRA